MPHRESGYSSSNPSLAPFNNPGATLLLVHVMRWDP
jgi:hypothetical protein